jgi:membrane associated rhomboid family serine protease
MLQVQNAEPPLALDACRPCGVVWFDAREFETVPAGAVESPDALILRGREALAIEKVKCIAEESYAKSTAPDENWKWVIAFLGMPVEKDAPPVTRLPWLTWSLSAVIALISIMAFSHLNEVVENYGFIPLHPLRHGGLTFISSFFLHAGFYHLLSNLYFFLVFGDNVEDYLGRWRFGWLLLFSTLGGDILTLLLDPHSAIPSVGASGGISGVLAFYALEFPRARLAFFYRLFWFTLPAWGAFGLWILLQLFTATKQMAGMSEISGLAHLGGALVGAAWWFKWRNTMPGGTEREVN